MTEGKLRYSNTSNGWMGGCWSCNMGGGLRCIGGVEKLPGTREHCSGVWFRNRCRIDKSTHQEKFKIHAICEPARYNKSEKHFFCNLKLLSKTYLSYFFTHRWIHRLRRPAQTIPNEIHLQWLATDKIRPPANFSWDAVLPW
jgi:hypothetical protein